MAESDNIKKTLTSTYGGAAADWKRVQKFTNSDGQVERHFQNAKLEVTLAVADTTDGRLDIHPVANAPAASPYCFAIQMMEDGQLDESAHTVQVLLTKDWKETQDNDWEPDDRQEREIRALLPSGATTDGMAFWSWPGMADPVETASLVAKSGKLPWRRDLQEALGSDIADSIAQRLAVDKAAAAKAAGPSVEDLARDATVLKSPINTRGPLAFRKSTDPAA